MQISWRGVGHTYILDYGWVGSPDCHLAGGRPLPVLRLGVEEGVSVTPHHHVYVGHLPLHIYTDITQQK